MSEYKEEKRSRSLEKLKEEKEFKRSKSLEKRKDDKLLKLFKQVPGDYGKLLIFYYDQIKKNYEDNIYTIIKNPNIPFPIALELFKGLNIPMYSRRYNTIFQNTGITISDIKKTPELNWDYNELSKNPNMTWKFIEETMESKEYKEYNEDNEDNTNEWNFKHLSYNPCITFDIVSNNLEYKWDINFLSENPNITLKIVRDNPDLEWNYELLARNPSIKIKDIIENKDIFKDLQTSIFNYAFNPNLNIKDVLEHQFPRSHWKEGITSNPGINLQDIEETPFLSWDLEGINYNPNLTFKNIINLSEPKLDFLLDNKYDGKHKKDVKFPKYWLMVYYLYRYIYKKTEPKEKIFKIAETIFTKISELLEEVIIKQTIPNEIVKYNEDTDEKISSIYGFIYYVIDNIINEGYKMKIKFSLDDKILNLGTAYFKEDVIKIGEKQLKLDDRKMCSNETDMVSYTEDIKDLDFNQIVSIEFNNTIFCLSRAELINFWNQELDEDGFSGAFNLGDCEFDEDDNPYEDTCKRFYKIPIPQTFISEKTKKDIEIKTDINYWMLVKERTVRIGGFGRISEYKNDNEQIYKAIPKYKYFKI
jgi:hypothetical protein